MWTEVGRLVLLQLFLTELLCAEGKRLCPRKRSRISAAERNAAGDRRPPTACPDAPRWLDFYARLAPGSRGLGPLGDRARPGGGRPGIGRRAAEHVFKYGSALQEKMTRWWWEVEAQQSFSVFGAAVSDLQTQPCVLRSSRTLRQSHQSSLTPTQTTNTTQRSVICVYCGGGKKSSNKQVFLKEGRHRGSNYSTY